MANAALDAALKTLRDEATGVAGSTGYVQPNTPEAKALEALLTVIETTVRNIDDIATMARQTAPKDGPVSL